MKKYLFLLSILPLISCNDKIVDYDYTLRFFDYYTLAPVTNKEVVFSACGEDGLIGTGECTETMTAFTDSQGKVQFTGSYDSREVFEHEVYTKVSSGYAPTHPFRPRLEKKSIRFPVKRFVNLVLTITAANQTDSIYIETKSAFPNYEHILDVKRLKIDSIAVININIIPDELNLISIGKIKDGRKDIDQRFQYHNSTDTLNSFSFPYFP